ncbi:MAG: precorrin-6y C5,15-methyltransferase (decarboxylating) subunit CbiE [Desulfuromusa sp.]|nr:precorrin-6y C5,15-methyltransferase (decarboxylating) subunit CbiE [Desulfuromusa sp.]
MDKILKSITIVGCGPGHVDYLTPAARKAAERAEVLVGAEHLLQLFPPTRCQRITVGGAMAAVLDQIELLLTRQICILVSGDCGLFSLAQLVIARFGRENCRLIPGISSVQLAFSRLALSWHTALLISAHGRLPQQTAVELCQYDRIALLAGNAAAIEWTAARLDELVDDYVAISCENLSLNQEMIRQFDDGEALRCTTFPSRTIILLLKRELLS